MDILKDLYSPKSIIADYREARRNRIMPKYFCPECAEKYREHRRLIQRWLYRIFIAVMSFAIIWRLFFNGTR